MINVKIIEKNKKINYFEINGHANSMKKQDEYDLICAAVSAVSIGILNYLDLNEFDVKIKKGFISINVKIFSKKNQQTLEILKTSLETIREKNEKYISIIKKEV